MKFILGTIEHNGKGPIQFFSRKRLQPQKAGISILVVQIKEKEKKKTWPNARKNMVGARLV